MSSWLTQLLPYIEQAGLWQLTLEAYQQARSPFKNPLHVGLATPIPMFACPANGRADRALLATRDNFLVAFTSYLGVEGQDLSTRDGVLFQDSHIRLEDITDGTSQTLLAGERPPSTDLQFGWWYAGVGQVYSGSCDMVLGVREKNVGPVTKGSCPPGAIISSRATSTTSATCSISGARTPAAPISCLPTARAIS